MLIHMMRQVSQQLDSMCKRQEEDLHLKSVCTSQNILFLMADEIAFEGGCEAIGRARLCGRLSWRLMHC